MRDNVIYSKKNYCIIMARNGFVIYNTNKKFKDGHTHIKSFKMAKTLIDCAIHLQTPKTRNPYLLHSLVRISEDESYKAMIQELDNRIRNRRKGKKKYVNNSKL